MSALAIDIGTYSLKAVTGKAGSQVQVDRAVEVFNTTGLSVPGDDIQMENLTNLLKNLISDHKLPTTDVRLALPEGVISTKIISIPRLSDAELASAIGWQAEQYIPIPPEELALEYQVLYRPEGNQGNEQMRVLLIGTRKTLVERYVSMFAQLGVEPTLLETQILSVIRNIQFTTQDVTTLVAHIGASSMCTAVVHQGELVFVFNHLSGGQMLTRTLEQAIGLDASQAEQYKRTYGLDEAQFQGKVRVALLPVVKVLTESIQKASRFFLNQYPTAQLQRILLSGGGAQLPGLVEFVTQELATEVLTAAPFSNAKGAVPENNQLAFDVCMGLLMREGT